MEYPTQTWLVIFVAFDHRREEESRGKRRPQKKRGWHAKAQEKCCGGTLCQQPSIRICGPSRAGSHVYIVANDEQAGLWELTKAAKMLEEEYLNMLRRDFLVESESMAAFRGK
jgi:hypothetical protein